MNVVQRRRALMASGVLAAISWLVASADPIPPAAAAQQPAHEVVIEAVRYEPEIVTVKRGETVVWVNKDPFPHTVTVKGRFDSREIAAGKSWKYTARAAGVYDYICTLHPTMKGTLKVE